jgi:hypothetical protein
MRRRASRLALSGAPSVAVLAGGDPAAIPEEDRYAVDLTTAGWVEAFLRLLRRPSGMAVVSSSLQAALVRLAGVRPVRASDLGRGLHRRSRVRLALRTRARRAEPHPHHLEAVPRERGE